MKKESSIKTRVYWSIFLLSAILTVGIVQSPLLYAASEAAFSPAISAQDTKDVEAIQGYCGIHCLYAAIQMEGGKVPMASLVKREYVTTPIGSSLGDLMKACKDVGVYAVPLKGMTRRTLENVRSPVILSVKNLVGDQKYIHYELFLGMKEGQCLMYDPPKKVRSEPYYLLAQRWNGVGVVVSRQPIDVRSFTSADRWHKIGLLAAVVSLVLAMVVLNRSRKQEKAPNQTKRQFASVLMVESCGLFGAALLIGLAYHCLNNNGILAHPQAVSRLLESNPGNFVKVIDIPEAVRLSKTPGVVFIDARSHHQYEKDGHIPGAINIPYDSKRLDYLAPLDQMDRTTRIVMYCCGGKKCRHAKILANHLISSGFCNIELFEQGIIGWQGLDVKKDPAAVLRSVGITQVEPADEDDPRILKSTTPR